MFLFRPQIPKHQVSIGRKMLGGTLSSPSRSWVSVLSSIVLTLGLARWGICPCWHSVFSKGDFRHCAYRCLKMHTKCASYVVGYTVAEFIFDAVLIPTYVDFVLSWSIWTYAFRFINRNSLHKWKTATGTPHVDRGEKIWSKTMLQ